MVLGDYELSQRLLPEFSALDRNRETATFKIAYGQACSIEIHKVPNLPSTVREDSRFVLAFKHLAVAHEEPRGRAMAQRFGLELLELLDSNSIDVRQAGDIVVEADSSRRYVPFTCRPLG